MTRSLAEDPRYREAQDCLQQLLLRSSRDLAFRRRLLTDPRGAIEAHLGRTLGGDLDIRFVENEGDVTIVLPDFVPDELTQDDQELVHGGGGHAAADGCCQLEAWLQAQLD